MWVPIKYWIVILMVVFCVLTLIECKEKVKKKLNSTQKLKKINTSAKKLIKSSESKLSKSVVKTTTTSKPIKSQKLKKNNSKPTKKSLLGSKVSKNVSKSAKQSTLPPRPIVNFANGLTGDQREKAITIVSEVLENTNKSNTDLVECIRRELDRELGLRTNVILSSTPFMEQSLNKIAGTVVMQLKTVMPNDDNEVLISVFGVNNGNQLMERSLNLMKAAQKLSPKIIDSLMSTEMKQEIQKLVTRVVRNAKSMAELSDQLSEVLNDRFGPHWHGVVGHKNMMAVDDHRKSSVFFLDMDFGDMRVAVFK